MPYQIYNRPIVDPGAIAAGQQFAAPFGRAREVADANQRRREDIARASGQRSEDIQRALDTQGFNVMQATLERAKIKLTPVQQPVLGADGKTTMQTTYQQAPRDPAEVNQIMTQQFGAGWEARMQSISQKLGMYGEGQPAPVTTPPGTTPPPTTPAAEKPPVSSPTPQADTWSISGPPEWSEKTPLQAIGTPLEYAGKKVAAAAIEAKNIATQPIGRTYEEYAPFVAELAGQPLSLRNIAGTALRRALRRKTEVQNARAAQAGQTGGQTGFRSW